MNKKINEDTLENMKLKQKKLSKNGINNRIKHNNDDKSDIIKNILKVNKIDNNSLKKNEEFQGNLNKEFEEKNNLLINEYLQPGDFKYINIIGATEKYNPDILPILQKNYNYKIIINIIVEDDSMNSCNDLLKIIKLIESSLISLSQIKIALNQILLCIFFQHFTHESSYKCLFPNLKFYNYLHKDFNNFYCSLGQFFSKNKIKIILFYKESTTFVEIYKFFYTNLLSDLINLKPEQKDKTVLVINWPNGKIFYNIKEKESNTEVKKGIGGNYQPQNFLKNVIKICGNKNKILIPDIEFVPDSNDQIFGYINKYGLDNEKITTNLHWYISCGYPIDHRFFFINMNYELFSFLKEYYQKDTKIFANEYYQDYQLVIYLKQRMKKIEIEKLLNINVEYKDLPWNLINFFQDFVLRRGSENANFFNLFFYFISCENLNFKLIIKKIFLFFKLLNTFIQFFWLGITFLISYAVFNDTFGAVGNKMDYFCSLGYVIMTIILLAISLIYIKNEPNIKYDKINRHERLQKDRFNVIFILSIFHYIYFFFFIICVIIAFVHIKQGKYTDLNDSEYYVFNSNNFIIVLFANIFIYFLPFFFRFSNIISKGFLYYMIFYIPCAATFFNYPSLFTCIKTKNSKSKKEELIYISIFVVLNGLVTVVCLVFDTTRQRRVNFFFVVGIIFSILNFVKLVESIIGTFLIKRYKNNYLNYLKDDNININKYDDYIYEENNEDIPQNNILTNTNFIYNNNEDNKKENNFIMEEKVNNIEIINNINDKNIINNETNNKIYSKNIEKNRYISEQISKKNYSNFTIINNLKKISKSSNLEKNIQPNIETNCPFPMDTIKNNIKRNQNKKEIRESLGNLLDSKNKKTEKGDHYPHDTTQSFSAQNSSLNPFKGAIDEKDLVDNI